MKMKPGNGFVIDDMEPDVLANAALWLRHKYQIPAECTIDEHFESEFKCKIHRDHYGWSRNIEFISEQDYLMFVLRWCN